MLPAICVIQSLHIIPRYFIKYRLILGKLFKKNNLGMKCLGILCIS